MNSTQWNFLKQAHYQANQQAEESNHKPAASHCKGKFVGPNNQLLSLVADNCPSQKVVRHLRIYCKTSCEFVEETPLEETNKKYLCRIFNLAADDELLLSYRVKTRQKKYLQVLAGRELDLEKFDYFMEVPLAE